jgi:hypothetical protein
MPKFKASFIEPMLVMRIESLPDGDEWLKELKIDGHCCNVAVVLDFTKYPNKLIDLNPGQAPALTQYRY